ncbi:MAG: hypothetical protein JKX94_12555, partial [Sneathiella sp.]|nr:hypothetical protein [Sneathiella sp.]
MLTRLKDLFLSSSKPENTVMADDTQVATAALLIESAMSDEDYSEVERKTISA